MLCFVLYLGLFYVSANSNLAVEYYQKLIEYETTRAQSYQLPTENADFRKAYDSDQPIENLGTHDFVIVGSGTAGSIVATRLSEISDFDILLIEAGGEENDFSRIPGMCFYSQFNEFNWGYYTTPQKYSCLGMKDQKCMAVRGKSIGGSSAINGALYTRGSKADFDNWAKQGNSGWSYKNVLPYFKKSQNSQINSKSEYQGIGGFWSVENVEPQSNLTNIFFDANKELDVPYIDDYNVPIQLGTSKVQMTTKRGKRQSTGTAFLDNARQRQNLKIITKALATKIIFKDNIAIGIDFVTYAKKYRVFARKEVILSAGVFNTPQLLMLSGIGPKSDLKRLKINLKKDLPVGKQLFNHPHFLGLIFNTNYTRSTKTLEETIEEYLLGQGALTIGYNCQAADFVRTNGKVPKSSANIEDILIPVDTINDKISSRIYNFDQQTFNYRKQADPKTAFSISISLLQTKSKGYLTLKSDSPIDFPIIDSNMLSDQEDVDTLIEAIRRNLKLVQTKPFQKINTTLLEYNVCKNFEKFSRLFWECIVRHFSAVTDHFCCSTPMGTTPLSVVDANLLVHGIKQLRIVDAGVFPALVFAHTNAATAMVAEKASDIIKKTYNKL